MKTNVKIDWNNGIKGNGSLKTESLNTKIAIPAEFGGSGDGASPKEILIASATACYTSVLVSMIESRDLPVIGVAVDSEGLNSDDEFKIPPASYRFIREGDRKANSISKPNICSS
ncbi:OsmC family protein [Bacillus glycinifermentans]|uniref:Osmotically inducible protein OsmC n=1 Tax=Bacillus glycinifermentans TaxID=1664069 RepID=A0ABU6H3Z6_9BACI|nr:hypothetical protein [Bacillus glycinifermentans]MEC0485063.1 hypothetical protein [Bacillus glycinifermentans]